MHRLRRFLPLLLLCLSAFASAAEEDKQKKEAAALSASATVTVTADSAVLKNQAGGVICRYLRERPADSPSQSQSAAYFHPLLSPKGLTLTETGPDDHRHHRGIFLAWVNMQGETPADFWGWGALAPVENRRIVNLSVTSAGEDGFVAQNEWRAGEEILLREELRARGALRDSVHVLDLEYRLTPTRDITLPRTAFSGFCVRMVKTPGLTFHDPAGAVPLPAPRHDQPDSDWPDRPWYAGVLDLPAGRGGAAVMSHPANPPALWHNIAGIGMLNPCLTAPAELKLKAGIPLTLRWRVTAFDGEIPVETLNSLAREYAGKPRIGF